MKFTSIFFKASESILFKDTNKRAKIVQVNGRKFIFSHNERS